MNPVVGKRHWAFALLVAALLHGALLLRIPTHSQLADDAPPARTIRIALAAAAAPQSEKESGTEAAPEPQAKPAAESEPTPEPKRKPEPAPPPEPDPVPPRKAENAILPKPHPEPAQKTKPPSPSPASLPADTTPPPQPSPQPANAQGGDVGSLADTTPDYRATLAAWLARHREYPRRARRLGLQGSALLYFVIDRQGKVLEWEIRQSAGHTLLDSAVEKLIMRANPMPAIPDDMSVQKLALTVPINFSLR